MNISNKFKKTGIVFIFAFICLKASGIDYETINPSGGTSSIDGIKIAVVDSGVLSVYRYDQSQYYDGYKWDSGIGKGVELTFRFSSQGAYNLDSMKFITCSTTPAVQNGDNWTASISGYVISPYSKKRFYVTINVNYVYPDKYFTVDYFVRAPHDLLVPETLHLYLDHDAFILGNDASRGYRTQDKTSGNYVFIGDYRDRDDETSCNAFRKEAHYPSHHGFKTDTLGFRSYYVGNPNRRNKLAASNDNKLTNDYTTSCYDDGIAVEFIIGPLFAGQTGVRRVLHCYGDRSGEFDNINVKSPAIPTGSSTPVTVNLTSGTYSEPEGDTTHKTSAIQIIVSGGNLTQNQICNFAIAPQNGTILNTHYSYVKGFIIPQGDYTSNSQTLTLDNINIIGDTKCNADRGFMIEISADDCSDLVVRGADYQATVTILDNDSPSPGSIDSDQTVCPGQKPAELTQTAAPSGGTGQYSFLWEYSTDSLTTWNTAAGNNTGSTYSPAALTQTTHYRRRVTSGSCAPVYSNVVTITLRASVTPSVAISAKPGFVVCENVTSSLVLTANSTNGGASPTYVWKIDGVEVGVGATYTINKLSAVRQSTAACIMTSSDLCASPPTASDEKTLRVSSCTVPANPHRRGQIR